jgi:FMN phosphatase YigB (HAD superfamily)
MNDIKNSLFTKKQVLLFDFDGTVFDTYKLKIDISRDLSNYTDDVQVLWETEKKLRSRRFHLVETMNQFCQKIGRTDIQHSVQEMFLNKNFESYIYDDVKQWLPVLKQNAVTALFTQGDESYQQVKIYQSQIATLFDFIYIYHRKMAHLPNILRFFEWKDILFIDNHLSLLKQAKEQFPKLKTVWINREHLSAHIDFSPDYTIESCAELLPLVTTV